MIASLQKIIAACQDPLSSIRAAEKFLYFLRKNQSIYEIFSPSLPLLKEMSFERLLGLGNDKPIFDLLIFISRYYNSLDYSLLFNEPEIVSILKREETKRIWLAFDHLLLKIQRLSSSFKDRSILTGKALEQIFEYLDGLKNEIEFKGIYNKDAPIFEHDINLLKNQIKEVQEDILNLRDNSEYGGRMSISHRSEPKHATKAKQKKDNEIENYLISENQELRLKVAALEQERDADWDNIKLFKEEVRRELREINDRMEDFHIQDTNFARNMNEEDGATNNAATVITLKEMYSQNPELKNRLLQIETFYENHKKETTEKFIEIEKDIKKQIYEAISNQDEIFKAKDIRVVDHGEGKMLDIEDGDESENQFKKDMESKIKELQREIEALTLLGEEQMKSDEIIQTKVEKIEKTLAVNDDKINTQIFQSVQEVKSEIRTLNFDERISFLEKNKSSSADHNSNELLEVLRQDIRLLTSAQKSLLEDMEEFKKSNTEKQPDNNTQEQPNKQKKSENIDVIKFRDEMISYKSQHESLFEKVNLIYQKMEASRNELENATISFNSFQTTATKEMKTLQESILRLSEMKTKLEVLEDTVYQKLSNVKKDEEKKENSIIGLNSDMQKQLEKHTEQVTRYIQEFVNEEAFHAITIIKSQIKTCTEKMDCFDWVLRNIEFISPKLVKQFLQTCHEIHDKTNSEKTSLFFSTHQSELMKNFKRLVQECIDPNNQGLIELLPVYLELLEVALFSDYNRDLSYSQNIHEHLIGIFTNASDYDKKTRDQATRCFAILSKKETVIIKCIKDQKFCEWISFALSNIPANALPKSKGIFEVLKASAKSTIVTSVLIEYNPNLPNEVFLMMNKTKSANDLLELNIDVIIE